MGDIAEIVLDYLHKHHFKNAEAAFKAELLARGRQDWPHPSTDNLLDWGKGPGISSSHASNCPGINDQSLTTLLKGDCHGSSSYQGKEHRAASSKRSKSPPKKHLSVEYESEQYCDELLESKEFDYVRASLEDIAVCTSGSAYHPASNKRDPMFQIISLPMGINASGNLRGSSQNEGPINNMQVSQPRRTGNSSPDHLSGESTFEPSGDKERNWGFELATNYNTDKCFPGLQNQLLMQSAQCGQHSSTVQPDKEEAVAVLPHDNGSHINEIKEALDGFGLIRNNIKSRAMPACNAGFNEERTTMGSQTMDSSFDVTIKREPANKSSQGQPCEVPAVIKTIFPFSGSRSLIDDGVTKRLGSSKRNIGGSEASSEILEEAVVDVAEACLQADCMEIQASEDLSGHRGSEELSRVSHLKPHFMDHAGPARMCYKSMEPASAFGSTPRDENQGRGAAMAGPLNEDVQSAGCKWPVFRPSLSQGTVEVSSGRYSALGDDYSGRSYLHEYFDSDAYEDDDDPGYHRQPIEDEEWFLAHEIDYPSDEERAGQRSEKSHDVTYKKTRKLDEDDCSIVEEDTYFSGEEYYRSRKTDQEACRAQQTKQAGEGRTAFNSHVSNNGMLTPTRAGDDDDYQGQGFDLHITKLSSDMVWEGFIGQTDELALVSSGADELSRSGVTVDGNNGFVRSDVGLSSDALYASNEVKVSFSGDSREGDTQSFRNHEFTAYSAGHGNFHLDEIFNEKACSHVEVKNASVQHLDEDEDDDHGTIIQFYDGIWGQTKRTKESDTTSRDITREASKDELFNAQYPSNGGSMKMLDRGAFVFEGFSFPSPASTRDLAVSRAGSGRSLRSNQDSAGQSEENGGYGSCVVGPDGTLASWKQKSNDSSPLICPSEGNFPDLASSNQSTSSILSIDKLREARAGTFGTSDAGHLPSESCQAHAQDEVDAGAVQEELRWMAAEDDQYEIFNLRVIHKKNRTGFEEEKDLAVVINSVIAGRYHVTEYLGSAAFSKAVQAHDLRTGMDVCMKIIKNNKDFFDQSLDEIKLLKFVNKHDPADKYHILRLYDYFYHREHLFIVCELLRANLYEFQKFNRESGGEVYFTMPRLQSITRQCLEALEFLHKLGIIHCDLKPENILVKSYSRCEIKIIDLGSSCFQTDHLCSYVQSRSYRAPEVILGLPYDQKIDIWSLGCILAELCSGNVLFQNDSLATLLARVIGILGPIDPEVLAKGRDTHKFFTKNHILYERNQENDQLEYLLPKKTSLRHRLSTGDQGFIEFVGYLLQNNPAKRPTASEALRHPWLSYPYEPASP